MRAPEPPTRIRATDVLALLTLLVLFTSLGWRRIAANDIGYHLDYGRTLFATGHVVDDSHGIEPFASVANAPLAPGCWIDGEGRLRFPNANWLSQALLCAAFVAAGPAGLGVLVLLLIGAITATHFVGLRRAGSSTGAATAAAGTIALMLQWRIEPRPELFGLLVASVQVHVLLATLGRGRAPTMPENAALVLLQVAIVNLHGYFLVAPMLATAFALEAARRRALAGRTIALLGALGAACLLNPWTWRLALLPLQTVLFLAANRVADPGHEPRHPWSAISEFHAPPMPWSGGPLEPAILLLWGVLGLALVATVVALRRRRVGAAAALALFVFVATSMRRNAPTAAVVLLPLVAHVLTPWPANGTAHAGLGRPPLRRAAWLLFAALAAFASLQPSTIRAALGIDAMAGLGFSPLHMPLGAVAWLDSHPAADRVWTDFDCSSNVHGLARTHPLVPLLTNTWAFPPDVMRTVLDRSAGGPFPELAGFDVVVLATTGTSDRRIQDLARRADWVLADLEPRFVVFARRTITPNAAAEFDADAWAQRHGATAGDRLAMQKAAARTCTLVGRRDAAIRLLTAVVAAEPGSAFHHARLGAELAERGIARRRAGDAASDADLHAAAAALTRALALDPGHAAAAANLRAVQGLLGPGPAERGTMR
ncbi:MAG: hypothetical protein JNK78_15195 [Planctomycetes bacterium]|nr:hypothetical protein [Planctomycetota bacterium]